MGGSPRLLLVAGLLAALLPAVVAAVGPQPGAPCEPTLLAAQVALFCAPGMATALCCEPVVAAVDLGVPCLCRVAAEPQLFTAGLDAGQLLTLYRSCGVLRPGVAHLGSAACEGPAPPAAVVSSPPPPSPAPRREQPAREAPLQPLSSEKPSSPAPQEDDGAAPNAKPVPTQPATSAPAPGPAPPAAVVSSLRPPAPASPAPRRTQTAHDAPPPSSLSETSPLPVQEHDGTAPAQPCTSPLAPAAATAPPPLPRHSAAASSKAAFIFVATAMRPTPPAASPSPSPSPSPSSETCSSPDAFCVLLVLSYIFTAALYLSPIPTMWHICSERNVGNYKVEMFLLTLTRCIIWTFYGLLDPIRWPLVLINGVGIAIQVCYLGLFMWHSPPQGKVRLVIYLVIIAGLSFVLAAGCFSLPKDPRIPLGILGDVTTVLMYAGPIRQLISVWQTKDAGNMSIFVAVFSLLNGICSTANGFLVRPRDVFVIVSSFVGVGSGTCQVVLWVKVKFLA